MDMNELKKNVQGALPEGLIVDENVLEKIVGGINTGMTRQELNELLNSVDIADADPSEILLGISKPNPGGLSRK